MPAVKIPFPTVSSPGEKPKLGAGRLVNAILEQLGDGRVNIKRAPGLSRFITTNADTAHCRGMIDANPGTLLVVFDGYVWSITGTGTLAERRGPLPGTDIVTLAKNTAALPDVVCVSPSTGAYILPATGAPFIYPDDNVGSPLSVDFLDGYLLFAYGDGTMRASGINSTSINALDVAKAESSAYGLLRGITFGSQFLAFGPDKCEFWKADPQNVVGFPLSRVHVMPRGLASTNAVAGAEGKFPSVLMWAGSDDIVYRLDGYAPVRVSNHDVERDLQNLADKRDLRAFVYMNEGHPFWCLKCSAWTWVYDLLTATWQQRKSYGRENFRGEQSHYMWGDWLIGDELSGFVFRPNATYYKEDTEPLVWEVESAPAAEFPARFNVPRVDFDFVSGTGIAQGEALTDQDPSVLVSWSDDGGPTWSQPLRRAIGRQGAYAARVSVNRAGRTSPYGRKWKLSVSDPVYVGLVGGMMQTADGAAY